MIRRFYQIGLGILLFACGGQADDTPQAPAREGIANLPRLVHSGRNISYIRYADTSPQSGIGWAFFLYPVMDRRNNLLALEYNPRSSAPMEQLFGEELLGISGPVVNENRFLRIEFLPISLPLGVAAGQQWQIRYARGDFACRSRAVTGEGSVPGQIAVSCTNVDYTLSFLFDRERGVTEFQDFCDMRVCTFELLDQLGLLSRATLEHMGLPPV